MVVSPVLRPHCERHFRHLYVGKDLSCAREDWLACPHDVRPRAKSPLRSIPGIFGINDGMSLAVNWEPQSGFNFLARSNLENFRCALGQFSQQARCVSDPVLAGGAAYSIAFIEECPLTLNAHQPVQPPQPDP